MGLTKCLGWQKKPKKFDAEFEEMKKAKEAQITAEIAMQAAHDTREHYRRLATSFDEAEVSAAVRSRFSCNSRMREANCSLAVCTT